MQEADGYLREALDVAGEIARTDSRLVVRTDQRGDQGLNNRIVRCFYDHRPAILKYYADGWRANPVAASLRRARELFCLQHFESSGLVPRIRFAADDRVIVMEEVEGKPLTTIEERNHDHNEWPEMLKSLSYAVGSAHGKLTTFPLANETATAFLGLPGNSTRAAFFDELLALADHIRSQVNGFDDVERRSIERIKTHLRSIQNEPALLYKHDLNPGNFIVRPSGQVTMIDFEQSYVGSESIYLGAVFDCLNFLDWDAVAAGFQSVTNSTVIDDLRSIITMAELNHWIRVVTKWRRSGETIDREWAQRFHARFVRYESMSAN